MVQYLDMNQPLCAYHKFAMFGQIRNWGSICLNTGWNDVRFYCPTLFLDMWPEKWGKKT